MNIENVNRVEVIDQYGRAYTNYKVDSMTFSLQDDGKTLKLFIATGEVDCYDKDLKNA